MVEACDKYSAGMLRTPCEFQRMTRTSDGAGGWRETWAAIVGAPSRCHFKALSGGERFLAQRAEATTRNRIVTRFAAGIVEDDRVVIGGRAYAITFVNNLEMRNRWLEIDISGGVAT